MNRLNHEFKASAKRVQSSVFNESSISHSLPKQLKRSQKRVCRTCIDGDNFQLSNARGRSPSWNTYPVPRASWIQKRSPGELLLLLVQRVESFFGVWHWLPVTSSPPDTPAASEGHAGRKTGIVSRKSDTDAEWYWNRISRCRWISVCVGAFPRAWIALFDCVRSHSFSAFHLCVRPTLLPVCVCARWSDA